MKVATQAQFGRISYELLQVGNESLEIFAIVVIAVVGVRRGDHMRDTVGCSRAAHGHGDIPRLRTVVYFGQDVRMNVDHDFRNTGAPPVLLLL